MDTDILKIAVTIALALIGWLAGHWFNSIRARDAKRRELVTSYLIDVYRKLDRFSVCLISGSSTAEIAPDINSAIADIQLFGSERQIEQAIIIAEGMANRSGVPTKELQELTMSLRNNLRVDLGLPETEKNIAHLNVTFRNA